MKSRTWMSASGVLLVMGAGMWAADEAGKKAETGKEPEKIEFKSEEQKGSYAIGFNVGKQLQSAGCDVDVLFLGIKDGLSGGKCKLSDQELNEAFRAFQRSMGTRQSAANKAAGEKNRKDGEAYLAENKTKPGVTTLPSGLQYKVLEAGNGAMPEATSTVTVHYRGTLIDGTEFDSSISRGEPAQFPVNGVIKGWTEALQLMTAGSKWQLFIPSDLAYGERGAGGKIGPNATLIFEVHLISIN